MYNNKKDFIFEFFTIFIISLICFTTIAFKYSIPISNLSFSFAIGSYLITLIIKGVSLNNTFIIPKGVNSIEGHYNSSVLIQNSEENHISTYILDIMSLMFLIIGSIYLFIYLFSVI